MRTLAIVVVLLLSPGLALGSALTDSRVFLELARARAELSREETSEPSPLYADADYVITDPTWCPGCRAIDADLQKALASLRKTGWRVQWSLFGEANSAHVVVIDRVDQNSPQQVVIDMLGEDFELPAVVRWEDGRVVRSWTSSCEQPLDTWTFAWLATGETTRPVTSSLKPGGRYPVRGGWWNVEGVWNASRAFVLDHMKHASQHRAKFDPAWLESLSRAELHALHSDDHEGRVKWDYVNARPKPVPKPKPVARPSYGYCPHCPSGGFSRRR